MRLGKSHDWHSFLTPSFKPLPGVKKYHYFRFISTAPGVVFAKEFANMEEEPVLLLRIEGILDPEALPTAQKTPGLSAMLQWYTPPSRLSRPTLNLLTVYKRPSQ